MIPVKKCDTCRERDTRLHGLCYIYAALHNTLELINEQLIEAVRDSKPGLETTVDNEWLRTCDFDCDFYSKIS